MFTPNSLLSLGEFSSTLKLQKLNAVVFQRINKKGMFHKNAIETFYHIYKSELQSILKNMVQYMWMKEHILVYYISEY